VDYLPGQVTNPQGNRTVFVYDCQWALQNQPLMGASKPARV